MVSRSNVWAYLGSMYVRLAVFSTIIMSALGHDWTWRRVGVALSTGAVMAFPGILVIAFRIFRRGRELPRPRFTDTPWRALSLACPASTAEHYVREICHLHGLRAPLVESQAIGTLLQTDRSFTFKMFSALLEVVIVQAGPSSCTVYLQSRPPMSFYVDGDVRAHIVDLAADGIEAMARRDAERQAVAAS